MISRDFLYSIHKDKKSIYLLCENKSIIDCQSIYEELYKLEATTDFTFEELQSYQAYIFLNSTLLTGSTELPDNEFYFGELDKDNVIKQDKPSYYFSPSDESSGLGRLSIFYKNDELCLLNYSILEKSLNIKLECLSKKSLEYKDLISNSIKEQTLTQIDKKQAIAKLHALLENQNLECIHGGKVILKSSKGKSFKDNNIPIMLESDLLNSNIVGCPYTMGNVSYPCTKVVNVKGALTQKKVNGEYAILQELISACNTDKGFPLKVSFTPTKFKFDHSFDPKEGLIKQSGNQTELKEPIIRLHYKSDRFQKDNLPIYNLLINNERKEQDKALNELNIEQKDLKDIEDINILNQFKQDFSKDYEFKELNLSFDTNLVKLYFIIPKNIAKVHKDAYKEFQNKDLGAGYFKELFEYNKIIKNSLEDNKELNEYHLTFLTPAKMQNLKLQIAKGLDEILEDEDRKQELYVCKFVVLNGGDENKIKAKNKDINTDNDTKDINTTKSNNVSSSENNTQEIIPDNVIRIETQDGSGEFIEIEFDESIEKIEKSIEDEDRIYDYIYDDNQIADASEYIDRYNILINNEIKNDYDIAHLRLIPRFNNRSQDSKKPHGRIYRAPQYAKNKRDVVKIIDELEVAKRKNGSNKRVRLVDTKQELRKILQRLIKYAEQIDIKTENIFIRKIQQHKKMIITRYKLKDDTFIKHRTESQSGGETIEINKNEFIIHNKGQLFK